MAKQPRARAASSSARPRRRLPNDERRERILEAARKAFGQASRPSQLSTIREIAAAGKMSEGTIYNYFTSKEELFFAAIVEPVLASMREANMDQMIESDPAGEGGRTTAEHFIASVTETWSGSLPILSLLLGDRKLASRFYEEAFASSLDQLSASIDDHRGGRSMGFGGWMAARVIVGGCLMLALELELGKGKLDKDELAREMSSMLYQGLSGFFDPVGASPNGEAQAASPGSSADGAG
ncbi:TetR/AcrR family transcriptional regulator [Mycobacterium vicinigordonae]|uniref:TetR/AcrR family transcriptional regulator n=1 Tax=Mycobacterium vicinigordonae TaxID=1719132 RepID=A0A7D6I5G5_9MYCO|nr:TetR/AcrR family transcriptional regulator [Mycobacterium vicinigordonae]QLL07398.1 TetR/AcrR family transcriptional regulator [Mycobacterium vicinigordonae]